MFYHIYAFVLAKLTPSINCVPKSLNLQLHSHLSVTSQCHCILLDFNKLALGDKVETSRFYYWKRLFCSVIHTLDNRIKLWTAPPGLCLWPGDQESRAKYFLIIHWCFWAMFLLVGDRNRGSTPSRKIQCRKVLNNSSNRKWPQLRLQYNNLDGNIKTS